MSLCDLTATDLAAALQRGEVSARQALSDCHDRVQNRNPQVNAFITLDWDAAEARAAELDQMPALVGPLHGIPIAIKDIFETRNLRTTWGSASYADHVPDFDALHVARLRAAGAVIIGKTNTPEFAFSGQTTNNITGVTRNPHNPDRTVAGSSGGSAAALAANMVHLADGSDLAGSLRSPAAWCGVVGYRPTSGLVPYHPNPAPFDGLSIPGPMARTMSDLCLMLEVMQGNTRSQPLGSWFEQPMLAGLRDAPNPARLSFTTAPFGVRTDPSIISALSPLRDLCTDMGWQVDDAEPDLSPLMPYAGLVRLMSARHVQHLMQPDMAKATPSFHTACAEYETATLDQLIRYQIVRAQVWATVTAFFETYDFALWPTTSGLAFPAEIADADITEDWCTTTLTPMLELPSISIPFGTASDGLPVGLHITGPKGSDARLLRFAYQVEQAYQH